jgi:hypothetical protein
MSEAMIEPSPVTLISLNRAIVRLTEAIGNRDVDGRDHRLDNDLAVCRARAKLSYRKRERAIDSLYKALCNDVLIAQAQNPVSGTLVWLNGLDWRGVGFWRDIIIGGTIHTQQWEAIAQYDGWRVWLEASAFDCWLNSTTPDGASPSIEWMIADLEPAASFTSEPTASTVSGKASRVEY